MLIVLRRSAIRLKSIAYGTSTIQTGKAIRVWLLGEKTDNTIKGQPEQNALNSKWPPLYKVNVNYLSNRLGRFLKSNSVRETGRSTKIRPSRTGHTRKKNGGWAIITTTKKKKERKRNGLKLHSILARNASGLVKTTGWCARLKASIP